MLLYDSFGPNPRAMRMYLAEKAITLPTKQLDLLAGDNRKPPYTERNPGGQVPALELDNGTCIGETVAIWEYLEEKHPKPALIGANAEDRAEARQWQRRIEQNITENLYNGFRFSDGIDLFKNRVPCEPDAAPGLKRITQARVKWLDGLIAGREFIVPNRFTISDIILFCALDFAASVGQNIDPSNAHVVAWFKRIEARPSAASSVHPASAQLKMRG